MSNPRFAQMFVHALGHQSITAHMPGELGPGPRFPGILWFDFHRRVASPPIGSYAMPEVIHMDALSVKVPYWPIVLLSGLPLAVWLIRRRRTNRRRKAGQCLSCGYDLRETPDRCPECGQLAAERKAGGITLGIR